MRVFLYQMKDSLAREIKISQSKSMDLDALREEEESTSLYMVHRAELEKAKCSSYEEEYDKSINNKNFPQGLLWTKYLRKMR